DACHDRRHVRRSRRGEIPWWLHAGGPSRRCSARPAEADPAIRSLRTVLLVRHAGALAHLRRFRAAQAHPRTSPRDLPGGDDLSHPRREGRRRRLRKRQQKEKAKKNKNKKK